MSQSQIGVPLGTQRFYSGLDLAWREVQEKLRRRARQLCKGDIHRADELLSDTALKVHLYLQHSSDRIQNLAGFLFLALNHAFLDHARRQGRENRVLDRDKDCEADDLMVAYGTSPCPEQLLLLKQQLTGMQQALSHLSADQLMLFELKFELDLPYPDIAAHLGINEALARKRVELLRKKLRSLMS